MTDEKKKMTSHGLSLIHNSDPTILLFESRMPS